jgi:hypothetical protein
MQNWGRRFILPREMENIRISRVPTLVYFDTILTETLIQDVMVARSREVLTAIANTRKILHGVVVRFNQQE